VLALHASYRHRPPRALRWLTRVFPAHLTLVYTCTACHQLVWINTLRPRSCVLLPSAARPRAGDAAAAATHRSHVYEDISALGRPRTP